MPRPSIKDPDAFETSCVEVYGAWSDEQHIADPIEDSDVIGKHEHLFKGACGDVRCVYCMRKAAP